MDCKKLKYAYLISNAISYPGVGKAKRKFNRSAVLKSTRDLDITHAQGHLLTVIDSNCPTIAVSCLPDMMKPHTRPAV